MSTVEASGLNASVLVLNRHYVAVHVINVRRAFGLLVSAPAIHTDAVARLASRARELTRK